MSANTIHHFLYHGFDLESTENLMVLGQSHVKAIETSEPL